MINRKIIRQKVLQNLYRQQYVDEEDRAVRNRKLEADIKAVYRLYLYLLVTVEEVAWFAKKYNDEKQAGHFPIKDKFQYTLRLFDNFIVQKLIKSDHYQKVKEQYKTHWLDEDNLVRRVFMDFKASEMYQEYIHSRDKESFEDEEILIYFLKHYPRYFNLYRQHLEEEFPNFADDHKMAESMAVKTVKNICSDPDSDDFLAPLAIEWEDKLQYAVDLMEQSMLIEDDYKKYAEPLITQWEPRQVPRVDVIILKMAMAEFLHFPSIPVRVTINEYLELTRNYSNPGSKKFVNAILDKVQIELKKQDMINKSGTGLFKNSPQS